MFFAITKESQRNFPHNHQTKNLVISLDEGWTQTVDQHSNPVWFKGYLDSGHLEDHAVEISYEDVPQHTGNFCVIKVFDQGAVIRTDRMRSFRMYHQQDYGLTNLAILANACWTDSIVMLNNDLIVSESKFDAIGEIDDSELSFGEVLEQIDAILNQKTQDFLASNTKPIRAFLSGGLDSAFVFSYLQKHTKEFELVNYLHTDLDHFYLHNHDTLVSEFWGYTQIHHWKESCVLTSGAPGDEFSVRSPTTANLMMLHYGTSIPKLLAEPEYQNCLHYTYFNKEKYFEMWNEQASTHQSTSLKEVINRCCELVSNDCQHWHLGNTLTWTPLRDLRIFKLIARLPLRDLQNQVMDGAIQKALIKKNNPELLQYLSAQKNSFNYMENLTGLYCK